MPIRKQIVVPATLNSNSITIECFNGQWSTYIGGYTELNVQRFTDKRKLRRAIYRTIKNMRELFGSIADTNPYLSPISELDDLDYSINSYIDRLI